MSKIDLQNITVLNYNENEVFVDSSKEHYKFNASRDGVTSLLSVSTVLRLMTRALFHLSIQRPTTVS